MFAINRHVLVGLGVGLVVGSVAAPLLSPASGAGGSLYEARPTQCVLFDTRAATPAGPLAPGATRTFQLRGDLTSQGGDIGCGVDIDSTGFHLNLVAIAAAGVGNLKAWPAGEAEPQGGVVNYQALNPSTNNANAFMVGNDPVGLSVKANGASVHVRGILYGETSDDQIKAIETRLDQLEASPSTVLCPGCDLSVTDLTLAQLPGAYLKGADFHGTSLAGANLVNADLRDANMSDTSLDQADFSGALLNNTVWAGADAGGGIYTAANMSGAIMSSSNFDSAMLANTDLRNATMFQTILNGATLTNADLRDADLFSASAVLTNLTGTNLQGADLHDGSFPGANFTDANIKVANLAGASFELANFTNADLTGSVLTGASLTNAVWLNTTCPDGTNSATNATVPESCLGHI